MKTLEHIQQEYRSSLSIPNIKPDTQCIVCPVGLIGSGKTTVITPIAEQLNLVRVSTDEYRLLLKENGQGYESIKSFIASVWKELFEQGHSIAVDANASGQTAFNLIKRSKQEYDVKIFWLNINTPDEYAEEGLLKRDSALVDDNEEWLRNRASQKQRMETLGYEFDFFHEFDISQPDLDEQIEACVEKLRKEIY